MGVPMFFLLLVEKEGSKAEIMLEKQL